MLTVIVLAKRLRQPADLFGGNPAFAVGDLFQAGDFEPLPLFDRLDEIGCLEERIMGPGVQPGDSPPQRDDRQRLALEVDFVDLRDLQFPRLDGLSLAAISTTSGP